MLKQKKRNLFENYKIIDKPSLIAELKNELKEKNINNINNNDLINENKENNLNDKINEKNNLENNIDINIDITVEKDKNNSDKNKINEETENNDIKKDINNNMENNTNNNLIKNENCKTNEDLEGLNDKYDDIGSIDEEIINNYIEEPKEINIENIIVKPKKRIKKPANNFKFELVIDKKSKNKLETEINNNMDINDNNNIDDNKEIENKSFNGYNTIYIID